MNCSNSIWLKITDDSHGIQRVKGHRYVAAADRFHYWTPEFAKCAVGNNPVPRSENSNRNANPDIPIKSAYVGAPKSTGMMHRPRSNGGPGNSIVTGSSVPGAISITYVSLR